jgi:hypothetical protein
VVNLTPRQALVWGGLVGFVMGMVIGISMRPHSEPVRPQPRVTVTVTKEVQQPAQVVTKNAIPEHCKAVIDAALKSQQAIESYEEQVGDLPRLLDEAGTAIYTKDQNKLNALKERSAKADADSIQNLIDIREQQENLKNAAPKCAAEMKGN